VEVVTRWGEAQKAQQVDVLRNVTEQMIAFLKRYSFLLMKGCGEMAHCGGASYPQQLVDVRRFPIHSPRDLWQTVV
jgi:hypothetical protein